MPLCLKEWIKKLNGWQGMGRIYSNSKPLTLTMSE